MPRAYSNSISSASSAGSGADSDSLFSCGSSISSNSSDSSTSSPTPSSSSISVSVCRDLTNDPDPQVKAIACRVASSSRPPRIEQERRIDGQVRRPANAFLIYSRWRRENADAKFIGLTTQEVSKVLGNDWKKLPKPQRSYWVKLAARLRADFDAKNPSYQYKRLTKKKREQQRLEEEKRSASRAAILRQSDIWEAAFGWRETPTAVGSQPSNNTSTSQTQPLPLPLPTLNLNVSSLVEAPTPNVNEIFASVPVSNFFNPSTSESESQSQSQSIPIHDDLGLFNAPTLTSSFEDDPIVDRGTSSIPSLRSQPLVPSNLIPNSASASDPPITPSSLQILESIQTAVRSLEDEIDWQSVLSTPQFTT